MKKVFLDLDGTLAKFNVRNALERFAVEKGLTGTARYVSLFTHYGIEQSRRDDIEGIAYNLIYLAKGKLPWQGVKTKNKKEKHKKIMESKLAYSPEQLCKDLPEEFVNLLKYSRNLEFEENPDYKSIKLMFKNHIIKNGDTMNFEFDWDKAKIEDSKEEDEKSEK